jgi:hypothetical protein
VLLTIAKFLLPQRVDLRVWNVKKDTVMVSGDKEVNVVFTTSKDIGER